MNSAVAGWLVFGTIPTPSWERERWVFAGRSSAREFHSRVSRVSRKQVKNGQLLLIAETAQQIPGQNAKLSKRNVRVEPLYR